MNKPFSKYRIVNKACLRTIKISFYLIINKMDYVNCELWVYLYTAVNDFK